MVVTLVAPRGEELMDIYARLFAAAPAVRPLFAASDLRRQKATLLVELHADQIGPRDGPAGEG